MIKTCFILLLVFLNQIQSNDVQDNLEIQLKELEKQLSQMEFNGLNNNDLNMDDLKYAEEQLKEMSLMTEKLFNIKQGDLDINALAQKMKGNKEFEYDYEQWNDSKNNLQNAIDQIMKEAEKKLTPEQLQEIKKIQSGQYTYSDLIDNKEQQEIKSEL